VISEWNYFMTLLSRKVVLSRVVGEWVDGLLSTDHQICDVLNSVLKLIFDQQV